MRLPLIPRPAPLSLSMLKIDLFSSPKDNVTHGAGRKDGGFFFAPRGHLVNEISNQPAARLSENSLL